MQRQGTPIPFTPPAWRTVLRDAALLVVFSVGLALAVNQIRSTGGIPLVATQDYEVLVPCPEYEGTASAVAAAEVHLEEKGLLLVDARADEDHRAWHPAGSLSLPFDYLVPVADDPASKVKLRRVLDTRARRIVVFGDGDDPDSGEQLARELAGQGLRNVTFVRGGAPALRARLDGAGSPP